MNKGKRRRFLLTSLLGLALVAALLLAISAPASAQVIPEPGEASLQAQVELAWGPPNTPDPANSSISADPSTIRADGFSQSTLTARIRDAANNAVAPQQLVGFAEATGCGEVKTAYVEAESPAVAQSAGHWTTVAAPSASGGHYLTANGQTNPTAYVEWAFWGEGVTVVLATGPDGGTVGFDVDGSPVGSFSLYTASPAWLVERIVPTKLAAGAHTIRVRATNLKDPASSGYLIRLDAFRSGIYVLESGANAGNAVIPYTADAAACVADISAAAVRDGYEPWFEMLAHVTNEASVPTVITLVADPTTINVDGASSALTATVTDQFTLPALDGVEVCFSTSLGDLAVTAPCPTISGGAGQATNTLGPGAVAGDAVVTASVTGYVIDDTVIVTINGGAPATVTVTPDPGATSCSDSRIFTALVQDAYGNPVAGVSVTFSATLSGSWNVNPALTDPAGEAQSIFTGSQSGTGTITAIAGAASGSAALTVHTGPAATLSCSAADASILASPGLDSTTITFTGQDSCGNLLEGRIISVTTSLGSLVEDCYARDQAEDGPPVAPTGPGWSPANAIAGYDGTGYMLTSVQGSSLGWSFEGTVAGFRYLRSINSARIRVWIDGAVVDVFSANRLLASTWATWTSPPLAAGPHLIEVERREHAVGDTIYVDYFETGCTFAGGDATVTLVSTDIVGTAIITGTVDGLTCAASVDFVAGPADTIRMIPDTVVNATCGADVLVRARPKDEWLNDLPEGTLVTFSDDLGGSFSPNPAPVAANGRASTHYTGHIAGTGTITATVGAVSGSVSLVTVPDATPFALAVSHTPSYIPADGLSTAVITATVTDKCGNGIQGVSVGFATTRGGIGTPVLTDADGVAVSTLTSDLTKGLAVVTVTAGALSDDSTEIYFVGEAAAIDLTPSVSTIGIAGCDTPTCTVITAQVRDSLGNPAADGQTIRFITNLGTLDSDPCIKFTQGGVVTATFCSTNIAGTAVITAQVSIPSPDLFGETTVTVKSCPLATFSFDLIATPQQVGVPF
ncbi:MAG: hypothetical protein GXY76_15200, partial [Chloroflexi bacterium]|nr:hypothetical protein [Chloroflexota bacterium]